MEGKELASFTTAIVKYRIMHQISGKIGSQIRPEHNGQYFSTTHLVNVYSLKWQYLLTLLIGNIHNVSVFWMTWLSYFYQPGTSKSHYFTIDVVNCQDASHIKDRHIVNVTIIPDILPLPWHGLPNNWFLKTDLGGNFTSDL